MICGKIDAFHFCIPHASTFLFIHYTILRNIMLLWYVHWEQWGTSNSQSVSLKKNQITILDTAEKYAHSVEPIATQHSIKDKQ
jgi:hypothetical protein